MVHDRRLLKKFHRLSLFLFSFFCVKCTLRPARFTLRAHYNQIAALLRFLCPNVLSSSLSISGKWLMKKPANSEYREDNEASFGLKPTKVSAAPELFEHFRKARLPALFDMHYGSRPGAQGKATLTVIKADGIANVNVFSGAPAKTAA
jgi:hypothetical protein